MTTHPRILGVLLAALTGPSIAFAQADQPSLDELLDLVPAPSPPAETAPADSAAEPDEPQTLRESVDEALSAADAADAFEQAVGEMDRVSRRLGRSYDAGLETQRMQESILRKLDQVIEAARQQGGSGGGGGGDPQDQDQDKGAEQLAEQDGRPQRGDPTGGGRQASTGDAGTSTLIEPEDPDAAIEQLRREWGVLPPRVREELSDGLRERFSPLYRRMTEAYYKALAEQE
jgi:hypothetical protein